MLVIKSCKKECLKAAVTSSHELNVLIKFIRYSVSLGASSVVRATAPIQTYRVSNSNRFQPMICLTFFSCYKCCQIAYRIYFMYFDCGKCAQMGKTI